LDLRVTRYEGIGENYIMRGVIPCTPHPKILGAQIVKNEMGGACGTYGREERCIQNFGGEP